MMSVGAVTAAPALLLVQEHSGISLSDVCAKPDYAEQSAKLWNRVMAGDWIEAWIAHPEACGSFALTAENAALACEIVVQRRLICARMPDKVERLVREDSNPNGFPSIDVC